MHSVLLVMSEIFDAAVPLAGQRWLAARVVRMALGGGAALPEAGSAGEGALD